MTVLDRENCQGYKITLIFRNRHFFRKDRRFQELNIGSRSRDAVP